MREIIFRGKRIDNKEWVEGSFVKKIDSLIGMPSYFIVGQGVTDGMLDPLCTWYIVKPDTVGQYTGLKDKNGKRIFEGDIVDCWSEGVNAQGAVQQRRDGLWIIFPAWQKTIMWGLCPDKYSKTSAAVIGNIHDNPELLKEE